MRLNCMPDILHHYQGMHDARIMHYAPCTNRAMHQVINALLYVVSKDGVASV